MEYQHCFLSSCGDVRAFCVPVIEFFLCGLGIMHSFYIICQNKLSPEHVNLSIIAFLKTGLISMILDMSSLLTKMVTSSTINIFRKFTIFRII